MQWYRHNFNDTDFIGLAEILKTTKGKYLLNLNMNDFVLNTFGEPSMKKEFTTFSTLDKGKKRGRRVELFYWN